MALLYFPQNYIPYRTFELIIDIKPYNIES